MANTTNFGWETPDDTDLVKDGAAAMRTLGNSIDASFVDLKGGTTGQILSKASNTDLDYIWINSNPGDITAVTAGTGISGGGASGDVTITNAMATAIDAKGDLIAGTGDNAFARLAVGTNGQTLLADSSTATGLRWGSAAATQSWTLISSQAVSSGNSVSFTGLTGQYDNLLVTWSRFTTSWGNDWGVRFNSDSGFNYRWIRMGSGNSAYNNDNLGSAQTAFFLDYGGPNFGLGFARISGAASNGNKLVEFHYNTRDAVNNTNLVQMAATGVYTATAPLSSIQLQMLNGSQTYTAGSQFYLYGA